MELASEPTLWLVGAVVVAGLVWNSAWARGQWGEFQVRVTTRLRLNGKTYRAIHGLTLPTPDGTTQVDHVIVSRFGVFVIETKNRTGWIFGDERSRKWTQSIYGRTYPFQNPLRQNYKHVRAVQSLLRLNPRCLHSVVVFTGRSRFKTPMPSNVVRRGSLVRYVKSKRTVLLADSEVEAAATLLKRSSGNRPGDRRRHLQSLKEDFRNPRCPRCGGQMVVRTAKRGYDAGSQFLGCSGYPRCRATKSLDRR